MASIIKVDEIKSQANGSALSIASGGNVTNNGTFTSTGAITASGGIADAGTISAGTLGSSVVVPASIGGSLVYLESTSGTNVASIAFENKFTSTDYLTYIIEFNFKPTSDSVHFHGQLGYGGSSTTWITSDYLTSINESYYGSSTGEHSRETGLYTIYATNVGNNTIDGGVIGTFFLQEPYNTTRYKMHRYNLQKWEENDHIANQSAGSVWKGGNAITAIRFKFASGNITGTARMYGLKAS